MAPKIQHKRSAVAGKAPLPADLDYGEIGVNYEATDPALYIKDSADAIRKIGNQPDASETVKGIVELATAAETTTGTDNTRAVHPAGLKVELDKKAPLESPALTGVPTAPTAAAGTNTTQLATTEFVTAAVAAEDLWDRTGTTLAPTTAGDDVDLGAGSLTASNVQMASANGGPLAGFRNQIINGDFRVWQRGTSVDILTTNHGYGADRWGKSYSNPVDVVFNRVTNHGFSGFTYACRFTSPTDLGEARIRQPIELAAAGQVGHLTGTWTLSWYSSAEPAWAELRFAEGILQTDKGDGWVREPIQSLGGNRYSIKFTANTSITANHKCLLLTFKPPVGSTSWDLSGVQLEPGPVATPFEHRPIGTELALCQRYYQEVAMLGTVFTVANSDAGNADTYLPIYIAPMRSFNATITPNNFAVGGAISQNNAGMTAKDVQYANLPIARVRFAKLGNTSTRCDVLSVIGSGQDTAFLDAEL